MLRSVVAGVALLFASEAQAQTPTASFPVESEESRAPAPSAVTPASTAAPPPSAATVVPSSAPGAAAIEPTSVRPIALPPSVPPPPEYLDYRLSMALADVAAVTVLITGGLASSAPVASVGLGVYALDGPTIHLIHAQGGRAAASLALRVGVPLLLGLGGYALGASSCTPPPSASSDPDAEAGDYWGFDCGISELALGGFGAVSGMLTAALVDDIALGRVRLRRATAPSQGAAGTPAGTSLNAEPHYQVGIAPFFARHGQGGGLMLVGTF